MIDLVSLPRTAGLRSAAKSFTTAAESYRSATKQAYSAYATTNRMTRGGLSIISMAQAIESLALPLSDALDDMNRAADALNAAAAAVERLRPSHEAELAKVKAARKSGLAGMFSPAEIELNRLETQARNIYATLAQTLNDVAKSADFYKKQKGTLWGSIWGSLKDVYGDRVNGLYHFVIDSTKILVETNMLTPPFSLALLLAGKQDEYIEHWKNDLKEYKKKHIDPQLAFGKALVTDPKGTLTLVWDDIEKDPGKALANLGTDVLMLLLLKKYGGKLPTELQKPVGYLVNPPGPGDAIAAIVGKLRAERAWFKFLDDEVTNSDGHWDVDEIDATRPQNDHHIRDDHVTITDSELQTRFPNGKATKFTSTIDPGDLAQVAVVGKADEIETWLSGSPSVRKEFDFDTGEVIGYGYYDGTRVDTTIVRVVLQPEPGGKVRIVSTFPNIP